MKPFDIIDHTADVGIMAYGADAKEAFTHAAMGVFSLITDLDEVREVSTTGIEVTAEDRESLLVTWLNELIYLFDTERMLFKRFEIQELSDTVLKARVWGEKLERARHSLKSGVKAATYHLLKVDKEDGYKVQVFLDV